MTAKKLDQIYIDGAWVGASGSAEFEVTNAATEEVMAMQRASSRADVDAAVTAARRAFGPWSELPVETRAGYLDKLQAALLARQKQLATTIACEVGTPLRLAETAQSAYPAIIAGSMAQEARKYVYEEQVGNSLVVHEPVGVVGCITPWNYPLLQAMLKVAPALAAGCTVVLKPSEVAPQSAYILAEAVHEIGLPRGVFNLVSGSGPEIGEALAGHPGIDMVSFTGSTRAGRRVSEVAAASIKRVTLELGGKSANLILPDGDLERAVGAGLSQCFMNQGQTCIAWTRMLVPRAKQAQAVELLKQKAEGLTLGDPLDPNTKLGPLITATQRERVRGYIVRGIEQGAKLVTGGAEPPAGLPRGYFVRPTVFADVQSSMTIAQEEIFGPVLSVIPYDSEQEAVRIANDTIYGLSGAVWSADPERAKAVARKLRTGQVSINGGRGDGRAPFGGFKQSGHGREVGKHGLDEYFELKSLQT